MILHLVLFLSLFSCCPPETQPCEFTQVPRDCGDELIPPMWDHVPSGTGWPSYPAATFPPIGSLPGYDGWGWPGGGDGLYGSGTGCFGGGSWYGQLNCGRDRRHSLRPCPPPSTVPEPSTAVVFAFLFVSVFLFFLWSLIP